MTTPPDSVLPGQSPLPAQTTSGPAQVGPAERDNTLVASTRLPESDRQRVLVEWNATTSEYPRESTLHEHFARVVERFPDKVAVEFGDSRLTYRELDARSNVLALKLRELGVDTDVRVGLAVERSLELIVSAVAIVKAGGAYVAMDTSYPRERLAGMVEDARPQVIIISRALVPRMPVGESRLLVVEDLPLEGPAAHAPPFRALPDSLAYVDFTSGSTGRPKGVGTTHQGVLRNHLGVSYARFGPDETQLLMTPLSFDVSTFEIWGALLHGARLVVMTPGVPSLEELARVVREARVTTLWLTSALFSQVVEEHLELLRPVKQLLAGGDIVAATHVRRVIDTLGIPVINGYGPTETTVFATSYRATASAQAAKTFPIGGPINNVRAYVLGEDGEPVAIGATGELFVGGEGLARGYMEQPALTAERFLPDPFHGVPGARMYRTGDLVRWRDDGVLEFLGRADYQVKVRGFRIELPEVEAALRAHPSVRDAVVLAVADPSSGKRLVAHVVPAVGLRIEPRQLRADLRQRLPEFMVPSEVVVRGALPLTVHGKVDRRAVASQPVPAQEDGLQAPAGQAPRGLVEEMLTHLVGQVLGRQDVARDVSFFDLGGHSLSATRLIVRVQQTLGVRLPLSARFGTSTVLELAREVAERSRSALPLLPEPTRLPKEAPRFVSASQDRMWFLHQLQPELRAYIHSEAVELRGPVDVVALEDSLRLLLERHPALRTLVVSHQGHPVPREQPVPAHVLRVEQVQGSGEDGLPWERLREEAARLFSLEQGPLYRFLLFQIAPGHHVLLLVLHHLVMDGLSLDILFRELGQAYAAPAGQRRGLLPEPELTFADLAAWERNPEMKVREDTDLEYWTRQLEGAPSQLSLPTDRPRPGVVSDRGAATPRHRLTPELRQALDAVCQQHQVTPFMVLYAAFAVLLRRYSGQSELCVGTPVSGRAHPAADDVVGLFINTVVLRTKVDARASFVDLLAQVRTTSLEAVSHQQVPFERVVEKLQVERTRGDSPLFQVLFDMSRVEHPLASAFPALAARALHLVPGSSAFDLHLTVHKVREEYEFFFRYRTELFDDSSVQRMLTHYLQFLGNALHAPTSALGELPLHTEAERQQVLRDFNSEQRPFDEEATVASLFLSAATRTPDAVALVTPDTSLTFAQLSSRATQLASHLSALGARPEAVVGLCLERSADSVIGLLAIHLSGSACLPLEPSHPAARRASLLRQSGARLVISRESLFEGATLPIPLVRPEDASQPGAALAPPVPARPDHLAYVLYTSGSTGEPKGVELTHRNLVHGFASFDAFLDTAPGATWAVTSSFSFDMHIMELVFSLTRAARVVLRPVGPLNLGRDILQHGITHIVITPSSLATAFEEPGAPEALRRLKVVVTGGEALPDSLVKQLAFTQTRLTNAFGPTETTLCVTSAPCSPELPVTLGKPLARTRLYVLDDSLQPLPVGVPGELFIAGPSLGRGYRSRPDLTAERFIPDGFSDSPGARMYRTGDRARWLHDGSLSFLGRSDFQLKIRGVRVELEEVEAALLRLPGVRHAAAIPHPSSRDSLLAFLVLDSPFHDLRSLRSSLSSSLPDAMVPSLLRVLDSLPLSSSGKVDRKALASLPLPDSLPLSDSFSPPRGPTEELLSLLFSQVLGLDSVSRDSDFFSLGGHSLSATRLVSRIRQSFGVDLPLASFFSSPSIAALAAILARGADAQSTPLPAPTPKPGDAPLLPTFAQERFWFLHQLLPDLRAYVVPEAVELRGPLDVDALEAALRLLLERHAALRTLFGTEEGRPAPRIEPLPARALEVEDVEATGDGDTTIPWERLTAECIRPFSLTHGPLYRFRLFRMGAEHHVLLFVLHHILVDGVSLDGLRHELAVAYEALRQKQVPALPAVTLTQADIALWQRTPAVRAREEAHLEYWKQQLAGAPSRLALPTDRPRPAVLGDSGALSRHLRLNASLHRALNTVCRQHHVTPFMVLYSAFAALLQRYSGQDELCVGTPVSDRSQAATEGVVGLLLNTVVLRTHVDPRASFASLLAHVRTVSLEAFSHQQVPFERVVESLPVERSLSHAPLFQVLFDMSRMEHPLPAAFPTLQSRALPVDSGTSQFDLSLSVAEERDGLEVYFRYRTELFDAATLERMLGHFERLLEHALETPEQPIGALSLLERAEFQQVVRDFNATRRPFDEKATLATLLRAAFERTPDAIALVSPEGSFTFAQLESRASQLASHLAALGARPETVVGLCLERSAESVVALLAIHLSGAACLPLEPSHPIARRASLLRQSGARWLISREAFLEGASLDIPLVRPEDAAKPGAVLALPTPARPEHLAYVLYTSGSTGEPKGAELTQRNLVHCFASFDAFYETAPGHAWGASSSLSFDMHLEELLFSLTRGARVVMRAVGPLNLGRDILQHGITHVVITPSSLATAFEEPGAPEALRGLKVVVTGGEALPDSLVRQLAFTQTRIVNAYGPTETSVCVAVDVCVPQRPVSLGRPLDRSQLYVLDDALQPLPVGVPGELFIGGEGLGRGYRARPDLTAERFIPDVFSETPGARLYRTGDRARWMPDGTLSFLGRTDFQLKIRGVRVELEEVEAALLRLPGIRQAAVIARQTVRDMELVAYLVTEAESPDFRALRQALSKLLPEAMVPSRMRALDSLPTNTSGKVDRKALAALPVEPDADEAEHQQPPQGPAEELLALLFSQVLGVEKVHRNADFFSLGGHSLSATRLVSRIRQSFGVELPLATLFSTPTVASLASILSAHPMDRALPLPAPTPRPAGEPPLPSFAQERLWFLHELQPSLRAYHIPEAMELEGPLDVAALESSLRMLLERHASLRSVFVPEDGRPVLQVRPLPPRVLQREDLASTSADINATLSARVREEASRAFPLAEGPLYRFRLFRLAPERHVLLLVLHHLLVDGVSVDILLRELAVAYTALSQHQEPALPSVTLTQADVAAWQRTPAVRAREDAHLDYWKQRLAGAPSTLALPLDKPRPAVRGDEGAFCPPHRLSPALAQALATLCRQYQVTPFMALYAAFAALLQRYSGQDELCVGVPVSGRAHPALEDTVGLFINTVVFRTRVSASTSFADLLSHVRATALEAFTHQQVPFDRVIEALHLERNLHQTPLFQVLFDLNRMSRSWDGQFPGISTWPRFVDNGTSQFDLSLSVIEDAEGFELYLQYDTSLFTEASGTRMLSHYVRLLEQTLEAPTRSVGALSLLSPEERQQMVHGFHSAQQPFDEEATVASLLLASAARTPDAVALVTPEGSLTFSQLLARASQLASHLAALGARPETVVGLCLERSADSVVALLAIHLSGAACLPLESSHPAARRASLLRQSGARLLISRESFFEGASLDIPLVRPEDAAKPGAVLALPTPARPGHLAYVIYTSGSTGEPKGAELTQRNLVHGFAAFDALYDTAPGATWAASSSVSFDIHMEELLFSLSRGARVVLRPVGPLNLGRDILQHGITHVSTTPSSLATAIEEPGALEALRHLRVLISGGEVLPESLIQALAVTQTRLINTYGPVETTICVTGTVYSPELPVTLGKPLARTRLYVLDDSLQPLPVGVPGELFIAGPSLGRGYRSRPDLTAERFIPDGFSDSPGARMYRTGDRARWLHDGSLSFLGRSDFQLKIRGVRVELEEVEAALLRLPGVRHAAAIPHPSSRDSLLAFLVLDSPFHDLRSLRSSLSSSLPDAMVPSLLRVLDSLPLSSSGKVDRKALASLPLPDSLPLSDSFSPPRGPTEELLSLLFSQVLGLDSVSRDSDFFSLGGHSLSATRLVSRIRQSFGVDLPLASFFSSPSIAALAEILESHALARVPRLPAPAPRSPDAPLLPTFAQERLWFLHELLPGLRAYLIPEAVELRGPLDTGALESALRLMLERHSSLRAHFAPDGDRPTLRLGPVPAQVLQVEDAPSSLDGASLRDWPRFQEESSRAFSLSEGPLYRFRLFRLGAEHHVLLLVLHHVLVDGLSLDILLRELAVAYSALRQQQVPVLPPVALTQADVATWQRLPSVRAHEEAHLDYWKRQLAGAPSLLALPLDKPRRSVVGDAGAVSRIQRLSPALTRALGTLCREQQVTPFMALYAVFATLLHRYSGQEELVVGSPTAGRVHPATEDVVGLFLNTVVLRSHFTSGLTFSTLLAQVRTTSLEAFSHQAAPFERVVQALHVERGTGHLPLVQVMFDMGRAVTEPLASAFQGMTARELHVDNHTSQLDLTLHATEVADGFEFAFTYSTDLFEPATAERMLTHYLQLLEGALQAPSAEVSHLPLLTDDERVSALRGGRPAPTAPPETCVHEDFAAQALRVPERIALSFDGGQWTYGELAAWTHKAARRLAAQGVARETLVAVIGPRDEALVRAILAVHTAGGAHLQLDARLPPARVAQLLAESQPPFLLASGTLDSGLTEALSLVPESLRPRVLTLDGLETQSAEPLSRRASPEALAYVLFTSGSTGVPKGVMVHHRGLRNHILGMVDGLGIHEGDVIAQTASLSFDISVWQMLGALTLGATTHLISDDSAREPQRLASEIASSGATVVELVPSVLHALLEDTAASAPALPRLRCMVTIGEALPPSVCRAWFERYPNIPLVNAYGPAECSDTATLQHLVTTPLGTSTPIGLPKRGMEVHVLDDSMNPVPPGVVGELYIGGVGVGRGYRHRPELTAERFMPHPFSDVPGARLYRTGDLGRRLSDGRLEFLARADFQVKVRGMRIELGEVEAALASLPSVRACAITAWERRPGDKELVAWVVLTGIESPALLREALSQRLPPYMVPARIMPLTALPLSANGKVDRKALALRPLPQSEEAEGELPQGATEEHLARLFQQVLGVEQVWRDSDFFALGGHSLSATRVVTRIRQELGVQLPLSTLFTQPTVAGLARAIAGAPRIQESPTTPTVTPTGPLPAAPVQERLWYALQLPDAPPYVLSLAMVLDGPLEPSHLEAALAAALERNHTLRTVFFQEREAVLVRVNPTLASVLTRVDLSHLPPTEAFEAARAAVSRQDHLPFDVARGPLYRFELLRLDATGTRHVLVLAVSHLVSDGLGLHAFMDEVATAYQAARARVTPLLPPAPLQYTDVARWQRSEDALQRETESLASWKQALANAPPVLDLPVDFPRRAPALNANMRPVRVAFSPGQGDALRELSRRERVSPFTSVLALVQSWLHRLSGQGSVVVASPFSGRTLPQTERMVGYFANVLPLCTDLTGNPSFRQLLRRAQAVVAHATAHQDVAFKRISDAVVPEGPRTSQALAQTLVMLDSAGTLRMDGLAVEELDAPGVIPAYDVVVSLVEETHGGLEGLLAVDGALFTAESGERMARSFEQWVDSALRVPDAPLSRLSLLSDLQRAEVLASLDGGPQEIPTGACIHTVFEAQVPRSPTAAAVAHGATTWSYAELNARANLLARELVEKGLHPEERVGVMMEPSAQAMAVLLGIMKAGGAYVPLDAGWPDARKQAVVERAGIQRLWLDEDARAANEWLVPHVAVPRQPETVPEDLAPGPRRVADSQVAYIVFTSGSTGEPKGVMVEHRSVVNHNLAIVKRFGLRAGDRMLQFAPLTFDAAAEDLYPPLAVGATVVLRNGLVPAHAMTPYLEETDITLISLPPTYIEEWIRQMESSGQRLPRRLRLLAPGGDVLKRETYDAWVRVGGAHAPWVNVYGPTECTITSATCDIPGVEGLGTEATFPIGRPIPRVRIYLLDDHLAPVIPGQPGGVYIGGAALSRGYLGAPHATAERFIPDPFSEEPGARMYRTGDLARMLPDGRLRFLGRADHQVKIRGFRIELSEIETCLRRHAGVEEAVVIARTTAAGVQSLCAYLQAPGSVQADALRAHVAALLPAYMVPADFVVMEQLPINANGKVDRQALPSPESRPAPVVETSASARTETPFRTTLEMVLHRLWREVLEKPGVSVEDDFFTIGGDSILAMRLLARLEDELGIPLPLAVLFQNAVLQDSAEAIQEYFREGHSRSNVLRLASRDVPEDATPLFLFHAGDGEVYHYRELVPVLEPHFLCYGIQAPETLTPDQPLGSFDERVAAYARDIRAMQPHGPYRLMGFSYGGYPAMGVAALLEAQGEQVELLAVVDTLTSEVIQAEMPAQRLESVLAMADVLGVYDATLAGALEGMSLEAKWEHVAERARASGMASPHFRGMDVARAWKVLGEVLTPQAAQWQVKAPRHVRPLIIRGAMTLAEFHDETFGWDAHLPREQLDLVTLPGQHSDLLREPGVRELARLLIQKKG